MHQPESGSKPFVADGAEPSSRQGRGCFEMSTQNLDEPNPAAESRWCHAASLLRGRMTISVARRSPVLGLTSFKAIFIQLSRFFRRRELQPLKYPVPTVSLLLNAGLNRRHHGRFPSRRRHHIPGRPNQRPIVNPQSLIAPRDIHQNRRHHC